MKIFLTGDTGYIGSVMVPMLLAEGFEVVGVDADLFEDCVFFEPKRSPNHARVDIRELTAKHLEGCDAVFHLAALSNDPLGDLNPSITYDINYAATARVAALAKQAGVGRFIFSSSCSLYGASGDGAVTEDAAFNPITPYARSKAMVEWSVASLADRDFSPVFLRNATAYGLSPRMRFDLVLNNLVAWAVATGRVLIKSDGTPWRPIVHIEDIVGAFMAAARAPRDRVHNEAFNIGRNEENYQVRDIAEIVREVVPGCTIDYAPGGEPDKRSYAVSFDKVERQLPEFKPRWTARMGAEQLFAAYRKFGVSVDDFEGPRFRRINKLKQLMQDGLIDSDLRWRRPVCAKSA